MGVIDIATYFSFSDLGYGDELFSALLVTLKLWIISFVFGCVIGVFGAASKISHFRLLRFAADGYTTIIRGVPEILVIFLLYYGGTKLLSDLSGTYVEVNPLLAGCLSLSTVAGAYATEIIRGAVLSIPIGQVEAAKACGMGPIMIWWRIILPQLIPVALPGLSNLFLVVQKDTALVSIVGLTEIVRQSAIAAGSSQLPFLFYMALAFIFLILTAITELALGRVEYHIDKIYQRG